MSDLAIGDVPELGTAIGDGLALALAQLRRSDAKSKVVILLSDGDSNWVTRFDPDEAARAAKEMGVKVYTLLVGREETDLFGGMSVNPATLRNIAAITGGEFFRATDYDRSTAASRPCATSSTRPSARSPSACPTSELFVPFAMLARAAARARAACCRARGCGGCRDVRARRGVLVRARSRRRPYACSRCSSTTACAGAS